MFLVNDAALADTKTHRVVVTVETFLNRNYIRTHRYVPTPGLQSGLQRVDVCA